jgi:hypothetical protein
MGGSCSTHGDTRDAPRILVGKRERKILGNIGMSGRIILKWILNKLAVRMRTEFTWLKVRTSGVLLRTQ